MRKIETVASAAERIKNGESFYIALGDFLDEFYASDDETREKIISEEPRNFPNVAKEYFCLFAAAAHKLANDYKLPVPAWVMSKKYKMTETPYFDCNAKGNLRLLFMYKSPIEFKFRNLFVDENFLMRV